MTQKSATKPRWITPPPLIILLAVTAGLLAWLFAEGLAQLKIMWDKKPEYSYGYIIPPMAAFLFWQRRNLIALTPFTGSWWGLPILLAGFTLHVVGTLTTLYLLVHYGFMLTLTGLALALAGPGFRSLVIPLLFLLFMIPLPSFFFNQISAELQLISSQLGVAVIRAFGISVHLQGNVIDLGKFSLQVVEACSGLRYLFSLMVVSFVCAYFFRAALWKRLVVFFSAIPITILMNSFRIGVIGILVEYWGTGMAEGFLHDFEGWAVFMAATFLLILEMWLLNRLGRDRLPFSQSFFIDLPAPLPADLPRQTRRLPKPFVVALALLSMATVTAMLLPERQEIIQGRADFTAFPTTLGAWQGRTQRLEQIYLDELKSDDYLLADYTDGRNGVNLYTTWYASQRGGQSTHSPRTCLPGGGWRIESLAPYTLQGMLPNGGDLVVNRAQMIFGETRQIVYYWFPQRGRNLTNEYLVKWYIMWDALTLNRTDGAMVRLITAAPQGTPVAEVDARLTGFLRAAMPRLAQHLPGL